MNVCVFCASSARVAPVHVGAAAELGAWIGAGGHTLVWGGCNVGLMDVVGRAARQAGARLVAVIPRFLSERGLDFAGCDERVETADLQERKARLRERAEAFVALPGGIGTWEEVLEVLALKKLGQLDRPIVLANVAGYYDPLLAMLRRSEEEGFATPDLAELYDVAADAAGVAARLVSPRRPRRRLDLGPVG